MALADYQPERSVVEFKGGSVAVRGLSLDDVSLLIKNHLDDLDQILAMYKSNVTPDIQAAVMAEYAVTLVREAPGMVAHIISLAADEPDAVENARRLPMPTQIELLKAIGHLTFEEVGGIKKFAESLAQLATRMTPSPGLTMDSPT